MLMLGAGIRLVVELTFEGMVADPEVGTWAELEVGVELNSSYNLYNKLHLLVCCLGKCQHCCACTLSFPFAEVRLA